MHDFHSLICHESPQLGNVHLSAKLNHRRPSIPRWTLRCQNRLVLSIVGFPGRRGCHREPEEGGKKLCAFLHVTIKSHAVPKIRPYPGSWWRHKILLTNAEYHFQLCLKYVLYSLESWSIISINALNRCGDTITDLMERQETGSWLERLRSEGQIRRCWFTTFEGIDDALKIATSRIFRYTVIKSTEIYIVFYLQFCPLKIIDWFSSKTKIQIFMYHSYVAYLDPL